MLRFLLVFIFLVSSGAAYAQETSDGIHIEDPQRWAQEFVISLNSEGFTQFEALAESLGMSARQMRGAIVQVEELIPAGSMSENHIISYFECGAHYRQMVVYTFWEGPMPIYISFAFIAVEDHWIVGRFDFNASLSQLPVFSTASCQPLDF